MATYTGYRINEYMDVNPQSPTFQETEEDRVLDASCSGTSANWVVIAEYCEMTDGINTGYYITEEMDVDMESSTYGQTRQTKVTDTTKCPPPSTDPKWSEDESSSYCEVKTYEPGHVTGYTGYKMSHQYDGNRFSATFGQWKWERIATSGCPAPDTSPQIEEVSSSCVMVECNGVSTTNGQKIVNGLDKNVFSPTYLSSITQTVTDTTTCPDECVDCSAFDFVNLAPSAPPTYNTQHIATYTESDGVGLIVLSKPDWIYKVTEWPNGSGKRFTAHMSSNPMLEERVGEVAFVSERGTCTFVATVTQSGATPCSAYSFTELETSYPASGDYKTIATYAASPNTLSLDYAPSWVDNISEGVSGNVNAINCTVHRNYSDARQAALKFVSDDQHCEFTVIISQAAGTGSVCQECNFVDNGITIESSGGTRVGGYVAASVELTVDSKPNWITDVNYTMLAGRRTKSIDITAAANTSNARTGSIVFSTTMGEETCTFTMNFTQESGTTPSPSTYVFTFANNQTAMTDDCGVSQTTYPYSITSTKDGVAQGYTISESCNWITTSINGNQFSVTAADNSGGDERICVITLTQNESGNQCVLTFTQEGDEEPMWRSVSGTPYCDGTDKMVDVYDQVSYDSGSTWTTTATTEILVEADSEDCGYEPPTAYTYVFEFEGVGDTAYTEVIDHSASEYSTNDIVSYKYNATDTTNLSFTITSTSNWLTASVVDDDVEWTADGNTSSTPRTGYIYLEQEESGNQIVIIVEQDAGTVN